MLAVLYGLYDRGELNLYKKRLAIWRIVSNPPILVQNIFRRFNVLCLVHLGFIGLLIRIAYNIRPCFDAIYSPCTISRGTDTGPQALHSCVPTLRQNYVSPRNGSVLRVPRNFDGCERCSKDGMISFARVISFTSST